MNLPKNQISETAALYEYTPWPVDFQQKYYDKGYWKNASLFHLLKNSAQRNPEALAIVEGDHFIRYGELFQRAKVVAGYLASSGLGAGDKVVLHMPNSIAFFEVLFACFLLRVIPVLALPAHRQKEIMHFIQQTEAKAYFCLGHSDGFDYRAFSQSLRQRVNIEHCFIVDEDFRNLDSTREYPGEYSEGRGQEMALLQLSGGTTNVPKLIPRTHDDYLYSIESSVKICGWDCSTVYLAALPVSHNFTLSSPGCLGVLFAGGKLVLSDSGAPDSVFPLIEKNAVNWTALVPPLLNVWLATPSEKRQKLRSLRVIQVGGARLCDSVAREVTETLGCELQQVFGMAEGLVNYTRLNDESHVVETTQGRPMSDADEVRIVDEEDNDVTPGEVGHLLTRGPYTIRGYFRADEYNKNAFTSDGYYRTGDMVRMSDSGHLVVEGRNKDQINRGGEKISVPEVEGYLAEFPGVLDVALISVPDEFLGERSCAVLVFKNDELKPPTLAVRKYLKSLEIADYKIPDYVKVYETLPKTALGKVNKKRLREMVSNQI